MWRFLDDNWLQIAAFAATVGLVLIGETGWAIFFAALLFLSAGW